MSRNELVAQRSVAILTVVLGKLCIQYLRRSGRTFVGWSGPARDRVIYGWTQGECHKFTKKRFISEKEKQTIAKQIEEATGRAATGSPYCVRRL
jgi:hypothetical protein